ncbi:hypothetical protein CHCC20372_0984 [Bacillus paralicheniformis]|nr:hypothetical protein CHCC20372_0984 [Bacillus paralicheniformis]
MINPSVSGSHPSFRLDVGLFFRAKKNRRPAVLLMSPFF